MARIIITSVEVEKQGCDFFEMNAVPKIESLPFAGMMVITRRSLINVETRQSEEGKRIRFQDAWLQIRFLRAALLESAVWEWVFEGYFVSE